MSGQPQQGRKLRTPWVAFAAALALWCAMACGPRKDADPAPARAAIVAPGGALPPIVPPATEKLEALAREILRGREQRLRAVLEGGGPPSEQAAAYGELGKAYQAFDLHEAAAACYENARRLDPQAFAWSYLLGRALTSLGRHDAAVAALERALVVDPASLPALMYLGEVQTAAGRLEEARAVYRRALAASPETAPASFALGRIAYLLGDPREAIGDLERAVAEQPGAGRAHYILALAYRQVGDLQKYGLHLAQRGERAPMVSDPLWDEVSEINPRNYAARALQALRSGNVARAVALMRAESAALPDDVEVRIQLGVTLSSAGANREAVAEYREALRRQPGNARALYYLGTALSSLGRHEDAVVTLRRALERSPESPRAWLALGKALRELGRHDEAQAPFAQAVRLDPTNAEPRVEEARLMAHLGRCGEAIARIETSLEALPLNPSLTAARVRLLATCPTGGPAGPERARQLARDAFASDGSSENAATVAFVLAAGGDWSGAAAWQRRALRLLPAAGPPGRKEALQQGLDAIEAHRPAAEW